MVSTRSTKRRSRSPPATTEQERPKKAAKTPEKPKSAPKRSLDGVKVVLLDIEGTICPITFVKDTLFPYALSALPAYLSTHWTDETFKTQHLAAFPPEHATSPATLTAHVEDLTAHDVKAPYLKALQGTLWDAGYRAGAYAAPVYADVLAFLDRWTGEGEGESHTDHNGHESGKRTLQVAIYSSGSVAAQKLFFEHIATPEPSQTADPNSKANTPPKVQDCRPAITAWFDTVNAGPKQEAASYTTIATSLGTHNHQHEPAEILFLSDNVAEVRAALAAGMKSVVVERHGNAPLSDKDRAELQVVTSFEELDLE